MRLHYAMLNIQHFEAHLVPGRLLRLILAKGIGEEGRRGGARRSKRWHRKCRPRLKKRHQVNSSTYKSLRLGVWVRALPANDVSWLLLKSLGSELRAEQSQYQSG